MRRVLWYDIETTANALKCVPKQQWLTAVNGWITQAHAAHCYSKHFHRTHPTWGAGALSDVVGLKPKEGRRPIAELYAELAVVFTALAKNRRANSDPKEHHEFVPMH